ncbi:MAG: anaerobic ribonucleoside-triphosphate reductase activating protein [Holosporales bacterium]|jgi:pyruvate formate lyase activating enzyme|nr:anaerobic ribonucleoside-triphosphate reductase activating protein [Holosporales bacterium]
MKIGGVLKFSTLDYPGKLSAIVFCQGCPNRCIYCHNPDFLDTTAAGNVDLQDFLEFLETRIEKLEAIVFSGGEPLLQPDLPEVMKTVKKFGFLIGLHTSGVVPDMLQDVLNIIDWVGFDIKTSFQNYHKVTRLPSSGILAEKSLNKLLSANVNFEVRTTLDLRNIEEQDLYEVAKFLKNKGIKKWVLQECILRNNDGNFKIPLPDQRVLSNIAQYISIEIRRE